MKISNKLIFLLCLGLATFLFFQKPASRNSNFFAEYGNFQFKTNYTSERIWTHKEFVTQRQSDNYKMNTALEACCSKIYCSTKLINQKNYQNLIVSIGGDRLVGAREYFLSMRGDVKDIVSAVNCFYTHING